MLSNTYMRVMLNTTTTGQYHKLLSDQEELAAVINPIMEKLYEGIKCRRAEEHYNGAIIDGIMIQDDMGCTLAYVQPTDFEHRLCTIKIRDSFNPVRFTEFNNFGYRGDTPRALKSKITEIEKKYDVNARSTEPENKKSDLIFVAENTYFGTPSLVNRAIENVLKARDEISDAMTQILQNNREAARNIRYGSIETE